MAEGDLAVMGPQLMEKIMADSDSESSKDHLQPSTSAKKRVVLPPGKRKSSKKKIESEEDDEETDDDLVSEVRKRKVSQGARAKKFSRKTAEDSMESWQAEYKSSDQSLSEDESVLEVQAVDC